MAETKSTDLKSHFALNADGTTSFWIMGLGYDRAIRLLELAVQLAREERQLAADAELPAPVLPQDGEGL